MNLIPEHLSFLRSWWVPPGASVESSGATISTLDPDVRPSAWTPRGLLFSSSRKFFTRNLGRHPPAPSHKRCCASPLLQGSVLTLLSLRKQCLTRRGRVKMKIRNNPGSHRKTLPRHFSSSFLGPKLRDTIFDSFVLFHSDIQRCFTFLLAAPSPTRV